MRRVLWSNDDFEILDEMGAIDYARKELIDAIKTVIKGDSVIISTDKANWAGIPGTKTVNLEDDDAFSKIYPNYECTFTLYKEGEDLYAVVSSHDIPTGTTWYFKEGSHNE